MWQDMERVAGGNYKADNGCKGEDNRIYFN